MIAVLDKLKAHGHLSERQVLRLEHPMATFYSLNYPACQLIKQVCFRDGG